MLPTGLFVKAELSDLFLNLPERLMARGPSRLVVETEPVISDPEEHSVLEMSQWSHDWCFIEISGPEELSMLVLQSVAQVEPAREVLSCGFNSDAAEYNYSYFRDGKALETFESRGPSIETVNFTSEIRRVPLQNLLRASDFMIESVGLLGIEVGMQSAPHAQKVRLYVKLPGKRTFWQTLLGTAWPR